MEHHGIINGFESADLNGVKIFQSTLFKQTGLVKHVFTGRKGGVSSGSFDSLNFSFKRENNHDNVLSNYNILADLLDLDTQSFVLVNGDHTSRVVYVDEDVKGMGISRENLMSVSDGMTTDKQDLVLTSTHADCVPVYFLDPTKPAISITHAGWRGTYAHIVLKTIDMMQEKYASNPEDILVAVGPCIGKCCFKVGADVADMFKNEFGEDVISLKEGNKYVDLISCIVDDLIDFGILEEHINVANMCTCCKEEDFFSHRRDNGITGTMLAAISLV
ncbi:MAG: peptidoglycan editing factor PgeF [Eubacteriales bacterium]